MKITGIGIISKAKAMEALTEEGRKAVRRGDITVEELGKMYKLRQVKKASKIGNCGSVFSACYKWISDDLKKELTPGQLGNLVDSFYECYGAGKNDKRED